MSLIYTYILVFIVSMLLRYKFIHCSVYATASAAWNFYFVNPKA